MKTNTMNGPKWGTLGKRAVYVESDAESADGKRWMKKLKTTAPPTYVMLDADGKEIGRFVDEAKREELYPKVKYRPNWRGVCWRRRGPADQS